MPHHVLDCEIEIATGLTQDAIGRWVPSMFIKRPTRIFAVKVIRQRTGLPLADSVALLRDRLIKEFGMSDVNDIRDRFMTVESVAFVGR